MEATDGAPHLPGSCGEHLLQDRYDTTDRARNFYDQQVLDHLNPQMRAFVGRQEMMFVSTADLDGDCDASFRAGPPGFVRVVDERHLTYPELRGNGVMASIGNISENGHIGLLFVDFFSELIGLHVNGRAAVLDNDEIVHMDGVDDGVLGNTNGNAGTRPERWVWISVDEAYIHCSKHIPLLEKRDRRIHWGTDDMRKKGGDHFGVAQHRAAP